MQRLWRIGSGDQSIFDNFISVQVEFLPLRCRGESVSPAGATDHQSAQRGEKAVPQHPTGNPVEQSGGWTGTRTHGRIVVTLHKPTRVMGLGQKGTDTGWAALHPTQRHPRETRRSVGSFTPRQTERRNGVTLYRSHRRAVPVGEQVSTAYCTAEGWLKKPTPLGKPEDMLT